MYSNLSALYRRYSKYIPYMVCVTNYLLNENTDLNLPNKQKIEKQESSTVIPIFTFINQIILLDI